jgi:hypothetical protein
MPTAVLSSIFVVVFFVLTRRLLDNRVAIVAALLLALGPFHIALSRVLHTDAIITTFMVLSVLAVIGYWFKGWRWYWLIISGFLAGLAFLTKPVGWFLLPNFAMLWLFSLVYHWQMAKVEKFSLLQKPIQDGLLWCITLIATQFLLFPASWVSPLEIFGNIFGASSDLAFEGHLHFFMGEITKDPGVLYYIFGWLFRSSPLEVAGFMIFAFVGLKVFWRNKPGYLHTQIITHPVQIALFLLTVTFFLFVVLSPKKMTRFMLPAFPIIDIFVAYGLLWLVDGIAGLNRRYARWGFAALVGGIIFIQGALVWHSYPYYFTYYNPMFGGATTAANLMTVMSWGAGMNEAAHYLNQQPEPNSLRVVSDIPDTLSPFFKGQTFNSNNVDQLLRADFIVYEISRVQRGLHRPEVWRYFNKHYQPVHRGTFQGLDFVTVYQPAIQHYVDINQNSIPGTQIYGYSLQPPGGLTLFWQNIEFDDSIWVGLLPAVGNQIVWTLCPLNPSFAAEARAPGAILESHCNLAETEVSPGLYDLRLGFGSAEAIQEIDFPAGRLTVQINTDGTFSPATPQTAIEQVAQAALTETAIPLDVPVGSSARLVGYRLLPPVIEPGHPINVTLYWQALQNLDLTQFSGILQLSFELEAESPRADKLLLGDQPLAGTAANTGIKHGAVAPIKYRLSLPTQITPGSYRLNVCVIDAISAQIVMCVPLPIGVGASTE